jgi:hypothetical protein
MLRLVYSLHFETEREPGAPIIGFVVPLDRQGNSPNFRPVRKTLASVGYWNTCCPNPCR